MPERPRQPMLFGGGLDKATGALAIEEASFTDLRNVYLYDGKAEIRRGLLETLTFASGENPIAIAAIRSQGIGVVITYKESTGEVKLYRVDRSGTSSFFVDTVWTLAPSAPFPKINCDDSYGKLYIAHDEEVIDNRQKSRVYNPANDTVSDYEVDLYARTEPPTLVESFFRGFTRWLSYLVAWGFGTENTGDVDRPEIVRISNPAEPDVFLPQGYLIVGQRGEAVVAVKNVGRVLVVRKNTDSHVINGTGPENFGQQMIDEHFGAVTSKLMVTVGDRSIFWSLDGPRISGAGPSDDIATPLDLPNNPVPGDVEDGFAIYNPPQREVLFIFGSWAYVLHLRNPEAIRWSYREYAIPLASAGIVWSGVAHAVGGGGGDGPAPPAYPDFDSATPVDNTTATIDWTNVGTLAGGELGEIWMRPSGGSWYKAKDNVAVAGPGESESVTSLTPGADYDIAVRFKLAGVYTPGYTSNDPTNWPAVSRGTVTMPGAGLNPPTVLFPDTHYECISSGFANAMIYWTINDGDKTRIEYREAGETTWTTGAATHPTDSWTQTFSSPDNGYYYWRMRHENTAGDQVSDWVYFDFGFVPYCP